MSGVYVSLEGINGIIDTTNSAGEFTLRNVPADENLTIVASRVGYTTARVDDINIEPGEHRENIRIELQESEIDSVFGFAVELDSIVAMPGDRKRVYGAVVNVPSNPVIGFRDRSTRLYFDNLIVDNRNEPVANSFPISVDEIPVKVFTRLNATLKDTSGGPLNIIWNDSLNTGEIRSDLVMENAIPNWIPGSQWAQEKIDRVTAPALWADGVYHGLEGEAFGLNMTGQSIGLRFWGFELSVDYTRTTVDDEGFHYHGAIQFPRLPRQIEIENLNIRSREGGGVEFAGVTVKTDPPIRMEFSSITVVDSSATWNESGFKADGAIIATSLDREFGFTDLRISPEGDFLSLVFNADARSGTINVQSAEFTISELGFGTDDSTHIRYFVFSGALAIPQLDDPIEFQNLKFTEAGDFTGRIQFNMENTIAGVVTLQLQAIEFEEDDRGKFIFIEGGLAFDIPNLHLQVGNIRYYEDRSFNIERIEISFRAGPTEVAVFAEWSDDVFSGGGSIIVQPAFSAAAQFRYGGSDDWWIKITANSHIPIGAVTIINVTGELGYQEGTWIFGFGGGFTAGSMEKAMRMDLYVRVLATPDGPIINGTAELIAMSGLEIGTASIMLDFVNERFTGNITFEFEKSGIEVSAQIDIDIKSGEYWYVGGQAGIDFFSLYELNSRLALANNYNGWMHTLPVSFHPDNRTIDGYHSDLTFHIGDSGRCWGLTCDAWAFMALNWQGDVAGGIKMHANAYVDVWIVGGSITADMEAAVQYVNDCFALHAHAGVELKLWIGCCGRGDGCWNVCWAWIFPCGGTACFGVDIDADYACNTGWDFDVDW